MKRLLLSVAAIGLLGGVAMAADLPSMEPAPIVAPVPVGFTWTGPYVGLQAGYSWGTAELNLGLGGNDQSFDADGFLIGGFAGYNLQLPSSIVLGLEGDISWSGVDGSGSDIVGGRYGVDQSFDAAIRARIGYAFDRALLYAAGGFAVASTETNVDETRTPGHDSDDTNWGWTIGAGVDYALTDNIFVRGEYRYTDLADWNNDDDRFGDLQDLQSSSVRLGVGVKF